MKLYQFAICCAAMLITVTPSYGQIYTTGNIKGVWGVFEDGGYCWIATKFDGRPKRKIIFTIDSDGDAAILLEPGASMKFTDWDSVYLWAGSAKFEFELDDKWARPVSKSDNSKILSAVLTEKELLFEAVGSNSKKSQKFEGRFKTKYSEKALAAMKKRCDWRAD